MLKSIAIRGEGAGVRGEKKEFIEISLEIAPQLQESFSSFLIGIGAGGVWIDGAKVKGFFDPFKATSEELQKRIRPFFERFNEVGIQIPNRLLNIEKKAEQDWNETWKQFFKPVQVTPGLIVSPPWEKVDCSHSQGKVVWIDPGFGFGTGTHPTTKNCLIFLDQLLSAHADSSRVRMLDLGSGSGILAIAAAKLGAGEILAAEVDGDAIESMRHNFMINQVTGRIQLRLGSIFQADLNSFHLVVANITAEDLIGLSRDLAGAILPGGRAILSGILVEKKVALEKAYLALGLRKQGEIIEDRWVTQVWEKSG